MNSSRLPGPVVVTGAASGIGRATATLLAESGVDLALLDRDATGLRETADSLTTSTHTEVCDVADSAAVAAAFANAVASLGPLAGVVSAAGTLTPGTLADTTDDDFTRHLAVNAGGALNCLRGARTHVRDGGAVVVVSSNAARVPRTGMLAYAASKAATSALARSAGLELAARGIRCNVVEPGSTDTPMQQALWADAEAGARAALHGSPEEFRIGIPLGRLADPADVAATICFLLSPAARHITLQQLFVDGGASL
ncbi:SDR family oxidoreductase [Nocardioides alcanivorans]|uniref:SDR family oxidoreductase n=1 Tax=Nocardioides alcanivorans TaxID=2897352 RepID=UPI001F2F694C|nr:SDR family oxidoreductase [Nocardioides alcanivorans]